MSFYRRNLPHYQCDAKRHFITFVTTNRLELPPFARQIVLESCIHGDGIKYNLRVAMVMPDHVHLILTPLVCVERRRMYSLQEILGSIKKYSARRINSGLGGRGHVWQQESFEHVIRSSESLDAKVAYILANPVRAGIVSLPEEYPWKWERPM